MSKRVVIVDDSLTVRMDLAEAFQSAGLRPVVCSTVEEARRELVKLPHVVVLDIVLPDGDGIELLQEIRATPAGGNTAVLMLSTEAEVADRIRALQIGADEYVGKPYDRGYVVARVRELMRQRAPGKPSDRPTVLVIDDSMTFREQLRGLIEHAGFDVVVAETGEQGLRMAADRRPTAIVVDGVLPGIDGSTVVRRVRLDAALRGIPCLLLTASEDRDAEIRALDAGADAFVRKTEDAELIIARLVSIIRSASVLQPDTASLSGPRKILAVDDSPTYLHSLAALLRTEGYDVVLARSGEEALDLLAVQPVDCVLLDLLMPGLGGKETCRRIKSAPIMRDIPLVMLTALEDRAAMLDGLGAGADDYIPKSSEDAVIVARVRAQIRRKQFEDENRSIREQLLRREFEAAEARAARELAETRATHTAELERKNEELEAFSYSVSHDLRAPLRSITGYARALVEDYADRLDDQGRDYTRKVQLSAKRMNELIDDLILLARVTRDQLRREVIDLGAIAHTVVEELRERDPQREVEVRIGDGLRVSADPGLIRTALENLIGNAWKYTAKQPAARIELGVDGPTWFVRDNGVGFEQSVAESLFRPFHRQHSASEFEGTGIGLATVARIVARHDGRVWAEGALGQGATVYFTLGGV